MTSIKNKLKCEGIENKDERMKNNICTWWVCLK